MDRAGVEEELIRWGEAGISTMTLERAAGRSVTDAIEAGREAFADALASSPLATSKAILALETGDLVVRFEGDPDDLDEFEFTVGPPGK